MGKNKEKLDYLKFKIRMLQKIFNVKVRSLVFILINYGYEDKVRFEEYREYIF